MSLTICSWNVNGLRAVLRTGHLRGWLERDMPDIVGMQEVKAAPGQVDPETWRELGYEDAWHAAEKPGYSGILLLHKRPVDAIRAGIGIPGVDIEGRVMEADIGNLTLITAYFPNGGKKGDRLPFKYAFYGAFLDRTNALRAAGRSVLFMGDLNVAHLDFDVARPEEAIKGTGFLPEERAWLDRLAAEGYVDTFRALQPEVRDAYTYWEPWRERRARNIGWRIDYVWASSDLLPSLKRAFIVADVMGSDHCPVGVELDVP
jgi:exodeoxyribonuclease-3